ncbi:MAG: hypothetical protein ACXVLQ_07980 [Bacteriovorax sp.]
MENVNTSTVTKSPQVGSLKPQNSQAGFEQFYLKKDYPSAANYLLQNRQHLSSGIFHYNLGTVYAKMGDYPAARFHLEKAIKDGYINSASLNNLKYIKSQLQVDDIATSVELPDQFINSALALPSSAYVSFSLAMLLLGLILVRTKKMQRKLSMVLFAIVVISPIFFSQIFLEKINYAVAFKDVSLYEGPSKIFSEKGKVKAGSKIILGEYREGWFYIKFPISLAGWVNKDQLGLY